MNPITKPPAKPAPLGRGLSALFGDADASYRPAAAPSLQRPPERTPSVGGIMRDLPTAWLQPGAYQPRRQFDDVALNGLKESILERGILEPLIVRQIKDTKDAYEIIAGERRWRAAQLAEMHDVPCLVRELSDLEAMEFGLIENIQRADLSPLEEAQGYQRLIKEFEYTQEQLAKIIGKSRSHIANIMRLLDLPSIVKQMIDSGELSMGHARALITAKDPAALARQIIEGKLTVRQAEDLAKNSGGNHQTHKKKTVAGSDATNADTLALMKELERMIGLKVSLKTSGKKGSLTLYYNDLDQLDDIIKRLRT